MSKTVSTKPVREGRKDLDEPERANREAKRDGAKAAKIRAVTLGSNFTARISCQVSFCRCKISGLELVFSVVDLDFRAVDQLIGAKPLHYSKAMSEQSIS